MRAKGRKKPRTRDNGTGLLSAVKEPSLRPDTGTDGERWHNLLGTLQPSGFRRPHPDPTKDGQGRRLLVNGCVKVQDPNASLPHPFAHSVTQNLKIVKTNGQAPTLLR